MSNELKAWRIRDFIWGRLLCNRSEIRGWDRGINQFKNKIKQLGAFGEDFETQRSGYSESCI